MDGPLPTDLILVLIWTIICCAVYVIPSVVAFRRNHPNRWIIFAINMAFGATIIGWIGSLVWALNVAHRSNLKGGSHGGESGLNIFINDMKRVALEPAMPRPSTADHHTVSLITAEIMRLAQLKSQGYLTIEEFERLKSIAIDRA